MARVSKKKRPPREEKTFKEQKKIEEKVFDEEVLLAISDLMNKKIVKSVDYPISQGKEAIVFRATGGENTEDEFIALKIYRIETSPFFHMQGYIDGDPRFFGVRNNKKDIVYAWTQKEFRNLKICYDAGVPAPEPICFKKNILAMEFLGEKGVPDSSLLDVGSDHPERDCELLLEYMKKLYSHNLVHADLSEYNVLMHGEEMIPYLIDCGQGVVKGYPKFDEFLERDVQNVLHYFKKYGIKKDLQKTIEWIKGEK